MGKYKYKLNTFKNCSFNEGNGEAIPTQEKTWPSAAVGSTDRLTSVESSGMFFYC